MPLGRKSLGAWASAAAESLLRDGGTLGLPTDAPEPSSQADPPGSPCRYELPGHKAHHVPAARAGELRRAGLADPVSLTDHHLVEAGALTWSEDSVNRADPLRHVLRLDLVRASGEQVALLTHDARPLAALEACDGRGLWWVPRFSLLLVPSWDDDVLVGPGRDDEPSSWPAVSVTSYDEPWLPCPVAAPRQRRRR